MPAPKCKCGDAKTDHRQKHDGDTTTMPCTKCTKCQNYEPVKPS